MPDEPDWSLATWDGNRRRQHREFFALPFRDKLRVIEELAEVAGIFRHRHLPRPAAERS